MLSAISNLTSNSSAYAAQASLSAMPKVPAVLKTDLVDSYQRQDGSVATRDDLEQAAKARDYAERVRLDREAKAEKPKVVKPETDEDKRFKEVLHQFVGQVLFGQMMKSMRATQEKNPYFHGGRAEEIFQSQLDMVLTDQMTKATSETLSAPMYRLMKAPKNP